MNSFDWFLSTFRACGTVVLIPKPQYEYVDEENLHCNQENLHFNDHFNEVLDC